MPERALVGALKRTRVSADDSPSASSPSARPSESKQSKRSVTFGEKHTLGTADAAVDRTPHGEPPRCGGCGLHCLGRLYACKACERRVSMESHEVGPAFHEVVSRAFNLCTVCFSAHVRVALGAGGVGDEIAAERSAKRERSDVARDVDVILESLRAVEAERRDEEGALGSGVNDETHDESLGGASPPPHERGRDALAMLHKIYDDERLGSKGAQTLAERRDVGVHDHSPYEFTRRNDADQQMLDAMAEEKRQFKLERGESIDGRAESWVDSGDEASFEEDGVSVGEVAFDAPASDAKPAEHTTWDYVSDLI